MKKVMQSIREFHSAMWCVLLNMVLPNHAKRMFFITTVYLNMSNLQEYRKETLSRLNGALTLADDDAALKLPALLFQLGLVGHTQPLDIFTKDVIEHQSEEEYLRGVCTAVLNNTSKWMLYGRKDDMFKDLFRVFKLLPEPV